ncbi:MAG: ThuA domain-containing protein [Acidobacteria bacterium]|nr:ThuA domain-containing protein [Acidobacteriota bacterium]
MNRPFKVATGLAAAVVFAFASVSSMAAQTAPATRPAPPPGKVPRHVLVIAQTHGFEHDSVSDAMAAVYNMGKESGLWDTIMRTDTELITKKELTKNAKNLNYFDAIVFASTTGELDLNDEQKAALLSFVHDDGKGYVGIHAAIDTLYEWPEYGKMTGGWFDQHPWGTFNAPIRNEGGDFPATRHFPASFHKYDEIYQAKDWSRANVNVLLSLDPTKLDYNNPRVHRADHDFAVAWSKMYGKGRVFYSTLGHTTESWKDPDIRTMYFEAIKWSLGMTDGSTASHPAPPAK